MTTVVQPGVGESSQFDPIDVQLDRSGATATVLSPAPPAGVFRWPSGPFPALLLLAGIAIGPHGLALLTAPVLDVLDPAAPVALATLGVVAGLHLRSGHANRRVLAATHVQSALTGVLVAAALMLLRPAAIGTGAFAAWGFGAIVLAIAAASSSSLPSSGGGASAQFSPRIDGDDALLPILAGGAALALLRGGSPATSALLLAQSVAIAAVIAAGAWLLLSRNGASAEERVFVFASLLLLGGTADYVSASALLTGLVAGCCWRWIDGAMREQIRRDVGYLQHSIAVFILLLAGAHAEFSRAAILLSAIYVLGRTAGKLAGGWVAARAVPDLSAGARLRLVAPGIFGVAFALNVQRAGGPDFTPLLTAVVVGSIASSLIASVTLREPIEW